MNKLTPLRNKNVFYTFDSNPVVKVKDITLFVVVTPKFGILFQTARAKMKDSCISAEDIFDEDWMAMVGKGFRVMKLFAGGYDRTDQSVISIDEWTDQEEDFAVTQVKHDDAQTDA